MEEQLETFVGGLHWSLLWALIGVCLVVLAKSADWLVEEAVALSERSGIPKVVIGATIVSLGTTTPEAAVSVLAAIQGDPSLALSNAVGSIICDTGLILGLACLIAPLPLPPNIVNRQGWVQLGAGVLLVLMCVPWSHPAAAFVSGGDGGGHLSQIEGFVLLALLGVYLYLSARWSMKRRDTGSLEELETDVRAPLPYIMGKLIAAVTLVVLSSHVLIPSVQEAALRLSIPPEVIGATLVAFGTSLPELVTAVTAARRNHGDLAVGNVVGADILNVLFVSGAAAAVTSTGLHASDRFFKLLFPAMLFVLVVFRVGIFTSGDHLKRTFGVILLATYAVVTVLIYLV